MSERVRIGCAGLPTGMRRQSYFGKLSFIETTETLGGLPKATVLRRWRREVPTTANFSLMVGDNDPQGPSIVGAKLEDIEAIAEAATALRADTVLFRTSTNLTPSSQNRERLTHFFTDIADPSRFPDSTRVWEPHGLWEPEAAARLSADLGVVYACDPLSNDPLAPEFEFFADLPGNLAYFRITGLGRPQSPLDEYQLDKLLGLVSGYSRAWVVFGSGAKLKNAVAFQRRCNAVN